MNDVEARVELGWLSDFYGPLLTPHRREVINLYCDEDMSLAEVAETLGITRQGVSDALNQARRQLKDYEEKLGLAARYRAIEEAARAGLEAVCALEGGDTDPARLRAVRAAMENILQIER